MLWFRRCFVILTLFWAILCCPLYETTWVCWHSDDGASSKLSTQINIKLMSFVNSRRSLAQGLESEWGRVGGNPLIENRTKVFNRLSFFNRIEISTALMSCSFEDIDPTYKIFKIWCDGFQGFPARPFPQTVDFWDYEISENIMPESVFHFLTFLEVIWWVSSQE